MFRKITQIALVIGLVIAPAFSAGAMVLEFQMSCAAEQTGDDHAGDLVDSAEVTGKVHTHHHTGGQGDMPADCCEEHAVANCSLGACFVLSNALKENSAMYSVRHDDSTQDASSGLSPAPDKRPPRA